MKCRYCDYQYMHETRYKYTGKESDKEVWMEGKLGGFYRHPIDMVSTGAYAATMGLYACPQCHRTFVENF